VTVSQLIYYSLQGIVIT